MQLFMPQSINMHLVQCQEVKVLPACPQGLASLESDVSLKQNSAYIMVISMN